MYALVNHIMRRWIGTGLVAVLLLAGPVIRAQDPPQGVRLTHADLEQLTTPALMIHGQNPAGGTSFATLLVRGGLAYQVYVDIMGNGGPIRGTWRLADDQLCQRFPHAYPFQEQCHHHYRLDDGSYEMRTVPEGKLFATYRVAK
jgi:hypothetical protein